MNEMPRFFHAVLIYRFYNKYANMEVRKFFFNFVNRYRYKIKHGLTY